MSTPSRRAGARAAATLGVVALAGAAAAQLAVRPDDPTGLSLRVPRLDVAHSAQPGRAGTSMDLQRGDPWRAYALGHALFQHEWRVEEGLFAHVTERPDAASTNSCAMCHNLPFRSAGFGGNVADPGGFGRNTPHLFGLGLIETLAIQIRADIMAAYDANRNGFIDAPAETRGQRARVEATPGHVLDFGSFEDLNGDHRPGLDNVIQLIYVDRDGRALAPDPSGRPLDLSDPRVAGYDLCVAPLAASAGDHQFPTLRSFSVAALGVILGLVVDDPTLTRDDGTGRDRVAGDGWAESSNAGAAQPKPPQRPTRVTGTRVGEGEIDLLEWFLMNHPAPARRALDARGEQGRRLLDAWGCTTCHVESWQIRAAEAGSGLPGDRRFFDLEVREPTPGAGLRGRVRLLTRDERRPDGAVSAVPRGDAFLVRGIFTDMRHHDVGERFYEYTSAGGTLYVVRRFRTAPLWGVGSSAPYGHDGRSLTLDDVIRRHGNEAERAAAAYVAAAAEERAAALAFLRLDLRMTAAGPAQWYSEVDTIPPVGQTASINLVPTPLLSGGRHVATLTSGAVKFREVVRRVWLDGGDAASRPRS